MLKILQYYTFLFTIFLALPAAQAQKNERIKYQADKMEYGRKDGDNYRKLTDNVIFTQESTTVYCDSSIYYRSTNTMEGFGHVRIVDDSTVITSKRLIYEGDARTARLRENVIYTRGNQRLYTDFLDYDLENEIAQYFNNGKLIDTTNTLTSKIGYFFAQSDSAQFFTNVVLVAPDYTLKTDTLYYNTTTKIARTIGPTTILAEDETTLHSKGGTFRTEIDQSEFADGQIETPEYILEGDQLYFDDLKKYYKAIKNVKLTAKDQDVIIIGEEGFYDKVNGISKIYGNPVMKRVMEADTFYLSADTLVAIESEYDSAKRILAYYDIKMYKEGLQGIADSMAYFQADSIIFFYQDPVMWNNASQVMSDTISLKIKEDEIEKMNLLSRSFMITEDTLKHYNQIKGRQMEAFFLNNQMDYINVDGNGEILYFALEGDTSLLGMNKIFCATMTIEFNGEQLARFRVYKNPEAKFIPPHELTAEIQRLEGFSWRIEERPELFDVAYYLDPNYDPLTPKPETKEKSTRESGVDKKKEEKSSKPGPVLKGDGTNTPTGRPQLPASGIPSQVKPGNVPPKASPSELPTKPSRLPIKKPDGR